MKNLHLILGVTAVGFVLAVGCGDDTKSSNPTPAEGGDNAGGISSGGKTSGAGTNSTSGKTNNDAGSTANPTGGNGTGEAGMSTAGGTDPGPGCGAGPACDDTKEECVSGNCLLVDGEACTTNADCVRVCIGGECAPRAEVLANCDYNGAGGAGAGGAGGAAGAGGGGGAGGENIYVPPEEIGNGEDADCLDGLACDSGTCKRKQMTDCTGPEQCLSGLCYKSKCTLQEPGVCEPNACADADPNSGACGTTTTKTNACSFNYQPNSSCSVIIKGPTCYGYCSCSLAP